MPRSAAGTSYGWGIAILPGIEQRGMFDAYNFSVRERPAYSLGKYRSSIRRGFSTYRACPSDVVTLKPSDPIGTANYAGNFGGPGITNIGSGTIIPYTITDARSDFFQPPGSLQHGHVVGARPHQLRPDHRRALQYRSFSAST